MISIEKACEIATEYRREPFVDTITDIKSGFVIGTMSRDGAIADLPPLLIDKESGKSEPFFVPDHFEEIRNGMSLDVPPQYKLKR